jgi:prepilin-type N-terminal cleavage/methylation domain-containing protein
MKTNKVMKNNGNKLLKPSKRAGFTLVELLVVLTISSILIGGILLKGYGYIQSARYSDGVKAISQMQGAIDMYLSKAVEDIPTGWYDAVATGTAGATGQISTANMQQILTDLTAPSVYQTIDPASLTDTVANTAMKYKAYYNSTGVGSLRIIQYSRSVNTATGQATSEIVNADGSTTPSATGFNTATLPHDSTDVSTNVMGALSGRVVGKY